MDSNDLKSEELRMSCHLLAIVSAVCATTSLVFWYLKRRDINLQFSTVTYAGVSCTAFSPCDTSVVISAIGEIPSLRLRVATCFWRALSTCLRVAISSSV